MLAGSIVILTNEIAPAIIKSLDRAGSGSGPHTYEVIVPYPTRRSTFAVYREGETTLELAVLIKMVLLVRGFRARVDEQLRKIDQSASRMETLSAIMQLQGRASQSDIARRLRVEGATVTRMVDILSNEGLVVRSPDPGDRRVNLLSITQKGEAVLERILDIFDTQRDQLLGELTIAELEDLDRTLGHLMDRFDRSPNAREITISDLPRIDRLKD